MTSLIMLIISCLVIIAGTPCLVVGIDSVLSFDWGQYDSANYLPEESYIFGYGYAVRRFSDVGLLPFQSFPLHHEGVYYRFGFLKEWPSWLQRQDRFDLIFHGTSIPTPNSPYSDSVDIYEVEIMVQIPLKVRYYKTGPFVSLGYIMGVHDYDGGSVHEQLELHYGDRLLRDTSPVLGVTAGMGLMLPLADRLQVMVEGLYSIRWLAWDWEIKETDLNGGGSISVRCWTLRVGTEVRLW